MVLKFSFANEIHRCSEFPTQFSQLGDFLASTFKVQIPEKYELRYVFPGTESERLISNQQDYDELLKLDSSKPIKVTITEPISLENGLVSDYDYIGGNQNVKPQGVIEENAPGLEKIVEKMSESLIVPQVNKELSYFSIVPSKPQDANIRAIVNDCIKEQLPFIISQVKDAVLSELRAAQSVAQVKDLIIKEVQAEEKKVQQHVCDNAFYKKDDEPEDFYKPEYIKPVEQESKYVHYQPENEFDLQIKEEKEEKGNFFGKIKEIGQAIKGKVVDLPGKAINAIDDWSHKIEGDPYVVIEEGRYPKSVVDKANGLKEVFVEENLKTLLDFIGRYPRTANLEQLAHAFLFKDQQDQNQVQEGNAENLDEPAQGNAGVNGVNGQPEDKQFWV